VRAVKDFQQQPEQVIRESKPTKMCNVVRHLKLPLDKVKTCDHLRDGMFNLQSRVPIIDSVQSSILLAKFFRVHLHKEELIRIYVKDEFNGASTNVVDCFRRGNRLGPKICAQLG
jgi:hypothetical protein